LKWNKSRKLRRIFVLLLGEGKDKKERHFFCDQPLAWRGALFLPPPCCNNFSFTNTGAKMARVTVEDCLKNVDNRFKLVLLASKRARQLSKNAEPFVPRGKNKDTVVAIREIAAGYVNEENIDMLHQVGESDSELT